MEPLHRNHTTFQSLSDLLSVWWKRVSLDVSLHGFCEVSYWERVVSETY
jgi:hypothetical protein